MFFGRGTSITERTRLNCKIYNFPFKRVIIFPFFKKGGKQSYSPCILHVILCFMKISKTVIEIQRGLGARMIDGQTSELKLLP